jgi:hypothetical protein
MSRWSVGCSRRRTARTQWGVAKAPRKLQETFSRVRLETTALNLVASVHPVEEGEDDERDVSKPNMIEEG